VTALAVGVVAVLAALVALYVLHERVLRSRKRRQAVVTTTSGATFSGVLYEYDRQSLVLRNVEALGEPPHPPAVVVDGEVVLRWENVAYVQLP